MIKILKRLDRKEWLQIGISFVFIVLQVWLDLKLPDYMSEITRLTQTPGNEIREVWQAGGKMLLCALFSFLASIIVGFFAARVAASFAKRLRSMMFSKVDSFSMEEINLFSTASLITRSTNDVTQIQMLITLGLQMIVKAPIMAIWAVTKIAGKGFQWTVATGVTLLILIAVISILIITVMPKFKSMQTLTDNLNRVTRENLTGIRVIRAYNAEAYQEKGFARANQALTSTQLFTSRRMSFMLPMMSTLMSTLTLAIYWIGAILINQAAAAEKLTLFSNMVVFSSYAMQVIMAFMLLVMIFIIWPRASVSAKRINEVLSTESAIQSGDVSEGKDHLSGDVVFHHVSFKYPDAEEYVLHDISFSAQKGETIAFIGSTGSGKSTLINLIPRFYDATEGEILIDGVNVKEYQLEALHNKIGYVPQKAVLFRGTVRSNVAYGENGKASPKEEQVKKAIRIAQGTEFVEKMDGQFDAEIAQSGTNISGGQKQRLSIARAICRQPEIYIFDDSFSALDYKTDRGLRNALQKDTGDVTSFIVAQRVGTIMDADQIIVLDEGRMVGKGKHKDLLATCSVYREIAETQLSEEELSK